MIYISNTGVFVSKSRDFTILVLVLMSLVGLLSAKAAVDLMQSALKLAISYQ